MKRSEHKKNQGTQTKMLQKGWPLCHLYQIIAAILIFLLLVLWIKEIIPWDQTILNHLQEWITQTWEEWIRGSTNS